MSAPEEKPTTVVLTRESAVAGRCLNPHCTTNHMEGVPPHHVVGLACHRCGKLASVAVRPGAAELSIACLHCFLELAIVHLPAYEDAAALEAEREMVPANTPRPVVLH